MTRYLPMQELRDAKRAVATDLARLMGDLLVCIGRLELLVPGEPDWQRVQHEKNVASARLTAAATAYGADPDLLYPPLGLFFS